MQNYTYAMSISSPGGIAPGLLFTSRELSRLMTPARLVQVTLPRALVTRVAKVRTCVDHEAVRLISRAEETYIASGDTQARAYTVHTNGSITALWLAPGRQ